MKTKKSTKKKKEGEQDGEDDEIEEDLFSYKKRENVGGKDD